MFWFINEIDYLKFIENQINIQKQTFFEYSRSLFKIKTVSGDISVMTGQILIKFDIRSFLSF